MTRADQSRRRVLGRVNFTKLDLSRTTNRCFPRVADDRLVLCAWLINQIVIVRTLAVTCLASALRATLDVATEDVKLAFRDATIVAGLATSWTPVLFFLAVANTR